MEEGQIATFLTEPMAERILQTSRVSVPGTPDRSPSHA